ncbi:hypothetical protein ACTXT7_002347 [Hymenolepis weldensis]
MMWYSTSIPPTNYCIILSTFDPYLVLPSNGPDVDVLPEVSSISWPYPNRPNFTRTTTGENFDLKLSEGQYTSSTRLLREFQRVMISINLQNHWFICAGSLLGSWRHHNMIPWDDDIDVCVDAQYREILNSALRKLPSEYSTVSQTDRDKFFFKPLGENATVNSRTIGSFRTRYRWSCPFLDIFYYQRNDSISEFILFSRKHDITDIFPLTYRPFGYHWYPAPRSPVLVLQKHYDDSVCFSSGYLHSLEHSTRSETVKCESLLNRHPFVRRCPSSSNSRRNDGLQLCDEHLVDGNGKSIHKIQTLSENLTILRAKRTKSPTMIDVDVDNDSITLTVAYAFFYYERIMHGHICLHANPHPHPHLQLNSPYTHKHVHIAASTHTLTPLSFLSVSNKAPQSTASLFVISLYGEDDEKLQE